MWYKSCSTKWTCKYIFNSEIEAVYGDFSDIHLGFEALGSFWKIPRDINSKNELPSDYSCNSLLDIKILRD